MKLEKIVNSKDSQGVAVVYKHGCYHLITVDHKKLGGPVTVWIDEYTYKPTDYATFDKIILSSGIELTKTQESRIFK